MAKRKNKKGGLKNPFTGIAFLIAAIVLMPTTVLLFFGMLPTVVAAAIDRSGKGSKTWAVGFMNLAGCWPFLLDLWTNDHTVERSLILISDPRAVIVIYSAAAMGYLIDWAVSGIVKTMLLHRAKARRKEIGARQEELIHRWGREVTGDLPLDAYGFPLEGTVAEDAADHETGEAAKA